MSGLQQICGERIEKLEEAYSNAEDNPTINVFLLQCHIAFELYANKILSLFYA